MPELTGFNNRQASTSQQEMVEKTVQPDHDCGALRYSTISSSANPRRIADHLIRIDERELAAISQKIGACELLLVKFFASINLSPGREVTLALPEERVVTLRRAGRGDVIWVDPAPAVYVIDAIVRGKLRGSELRSLLQSADASDLEAPLVGLYCQGFAIQGVLPKRDDYHEYKEWRNEAISRASYALHELAHIKEKASEYVAFKRDNSYRARLGVELMASPQEILDNIASSLYSPRDIMRAVIDAATIENARMVTAELNDPVMARWYGCSQGGGQGFLVRAWRGTDEWNLCVSRVSGKALADNLSFNLVLQQPIVKVSIPNHELLVRASSPDTVLPEDDVDTVVRRGVAKIAESVMNKLLERSANQAPVSRNDTHSVFLELGLIERRTPFVNFFLDLIGT